MTEHPESTHRHDMYVNRQFISLMKQEDNADIVRMLTMGLAINDPVPLTPLSPPEEQPLRPPTPRVAFVQEEDPTDVATGVDKDGDEMRAAYAEGVSVSDYYDSNAAVIFRTSEGGFLMPIERVPGFIAWLQSRVAKSERNAH